MSVRRKNHGFTFVEVAIATALIMVGLLALLKLSDYMRQSALIPDAQSRRDALAKTIKEVLSYQSTCTRAVVGVGLNSSGMSGAAIVGETQQVRLLLPGAQGDSTPANDVVAAGSQVPRLNIVNLRLTNAVDLGGGRYFSQVFLDAQPQGSTLSLKPVTTGAFYFTVSGNAIVSCDNEGLDPTPLCVEMGCTWNPSATPTCQCPALSLSCPPLHFMTAIDNAGNPVCTPLGGPPCAPGTYLRGIGIGTSDCATLPP